MVAVAMLIGACGAEVPAPPSPSPSPAPSLSPEPSPSPEAEPGEMPMSFEADLSPPRLPPEDLVPDAATVTGEWFAFTDSGVMVLIAWVEPGSDFTRLPRGFAAWGRYASEPHWRVELVVRRDAQDGIQEIQISTADLTGDHTDDALVFEGIGGSGGCGDWSVIDLSRLEETYRRQICDGRVDAGPARSPGLILTESLYREGDAHCCPSAVRTTTLVWKGGAWRVTEKAVTGT